MESQGELDAGELSANGPTDHSSSARDLATDHTVYAINEAVLGDAHDLSVADSTLPVSFDGFDEVQETWAFDEDRALYSTTWALELAWTDPAATIAWQLGEVDVSAHPVLSLRLLAVHDDPLNPDDGLLDLDIELVDADGDVAAWGLSDSAHGALRPTP